MRREARQQYRLLRQLIAAGNEDDGSCPKGGVAPGSEVARPRAFHCAVAGGKLRGGHRRFPDRVWLRHQPVFGRTTDDR